MELYLTHRPKVGRKHTRIEMLLSLDLELAQGSDRSVSELARLWGVSRETARAVVRDYRRTADSLGTSHGTEATTSLATQRASKTPAVSRGSPLPADTSLGTQAGTPPPTQAGSGIAPIKTQSNESERSGSRTRTGKLRHDVAPSRATTPDLPLSAWWIAGRLREHVAACKGAQVPKDTRALRGWAAEIARIDAEPALILEAIAWLFDPAGNLERGEFAFVVRSGAKLRKRFADIVGCMEKRHATPENRATAKASVEADRTQERIASERQETLTRMWTEGEIDAPTEAAFQAARARWRREGRLKPPEGGDHDDDSTHAR